MPAVPEFRIPTFAICFTYLVHNNWRRGAKSFENYTTRVREYCLALLSSTKHFHMFFIMMLAASLQLNVLEMLSLSVEIVFAEFCEPGMYLVPY
jgi:hypothetical protein